MKIKTFYISLLLMSITLLFIPGSTQADIYPVANTNDSGAGSLRQAILDANSHAGSDTLVFNISPSDLGYNPDTGVWTIRPASSLPAIEKDGLLIDGHSQSLFIGENKNPLGPEIQIDGSNAGDTGGLHILAPGIEIVELLINNFNRFGIHVYGVKNGRVSGCYIGVSFNGLDPVSNFTGIELHETQEFHITASESMPNIISGNKLHGIYMVGSSNNLIARNIIGLNSIKTDTLGNRQSGIFMMSSCDSNEIVDNFIGGNKQNGIILFSGKGNVIVHNAIGCGDREQPEMNLGNGSVGIYISSSDNLIMENAIAYNFSYGVQIYGPQAVRNTLTRNLIYQNSWAGISNEEGGNNDLAAPLLINATLNSVAGTASKNSTVEIFADKKNQGAIYLGTVPVDASGTVNWNGDDIPSELFFTATATDTEGSTSEFSNAIAPSTDVENSRKLNTPNHFALYQNYPNPFNLSTSIEFALSKPAFVMLKIYNQLGKEVAMLVAEQREAGIHRINWDAKGLASGVYLYRLEARSFMQVKKLILMR